MFEVEGENLVELVAMFDDNEISARLLRKFPPLMMEEKTHRSIVEGEI